MGPHEWNMGRGLGPICGLLRGLDMTANLEGYILSLVYLGIHHSKVIAEADTYHRDVPMVD
jgi:hypothetical protein